MMVTTVYEGLYAQDDDDGQPAVTVTTVTEGTWLEEIDAVTEGTGVKKMVSSELEVDGKEVELAVTVTMVNAGVLLWVYELLVTVGVEINDRIFELAVIVTMVNEGVWLWDTAPVTVEAGTTETVSSE
jgi:hypothetical protein